MVPFFSLHLLILLACFVLVRRGWWRSLHHRRIESLSLKARTKIKQVVDKNWDKLLRCSKDLIDARLEDGKRNYETFVIWRLLHLSYKTQRLMSKSQVV